MANGDLVYSHVPADNGALVCCRVGANAGKMAFYRRRTYWWCEILITLDVYYSGAAWNTSRSPFVNAAMADWADYLGMSVTGTYPDRAEGSATLYGYFGWEYGTGAPTTSDGVVNVNSSSTYPFSGGRYYGQITLTAQPRVNLRFGTRSYWYEVPATASALGTRYSGSKTVDARGAQYSTGNGYDALLTLTLILHAYAHNPACPH